LKRNYLIKTDKEIGKLLERNWKCIKSKRFFENLIKDKNKFLDIQDIKNVITKNDGKLISKKYLGYTIKLKIKCKNNHIFKCCPDKLIQGRWCPYCKFLKLKKLFQFTIRDMQNIAKNRGGKCLSEKYKNAHKKLKWECANKHQWYAPYCKISIDQWCPQCHTFIREERCREIFEKIFNNKFPKIRPSWLISPKGFRMELDGYCAKLGLAFELISTVKHLCPLDSAILLKLFVPLNNSKTFIFRFPLDLGIYFPFSSSFIFCLTCL